MSNSQSVITPVSIDRDGTVHLGARNIPVPKTISPEAQQYLSTPPWGDASPPPNLPLWEWRTTFESMFKMLDDMTRSRFSLPDSLFAASQRARTLNIRPSCWLREIRIRDVIRCTHARWSRSSNGRQPLIAPSFFTIVPKPDTCRPCRWTRQSMRSPISSRFYSVRSG